MLKNFLFCFFSGRLGRVTLDLGAFDGFIEKVGVDFGAVRRECGWVGWVGLG